MQNNPKSIDEIYLNRCFQLAQLGAGSVSPNPMVGAVLVHQEKIIGEGWHKKYGESHAEVNCLASVSAQNRAFISETTLYCNLEPCHHFGKTPPCVDLILAHKIPKVVLSNLDPNPLTAGKSVQKLRENGVEVTTHILEKEGEWLNRAFFVWINKKRPFILLKWAQSADGFMGRVGERTVISNPQTQRLSHRWRAESDAILVGTNTAITDNPSLTNRLFFGKNPLRIVIDVENKVPKTHQIFDESADTWVLKNGDNSLISNLLAQLYESEKATLIVEGGAILLQQFIDLALWDEARIFQSKSTLGSGVRAPNLAGATQVSQNILGDNHLLVFAKID